MEIKNKKCSELIGAEYNPRELTEKQYSDLKDSLLRFGVVDPVLINVNPDRKNIIVGGHQRKRVWEELGNKTIPCVELDLTLEQERELNVRLNKNTGQFDMEALANYFDTEELTEWGFEAFEFGINETEEEEKEEEDGFKVNTYEVKITFSNKEDQQKAIKRINELEQDGEDISELLMKILF